MEAEMVVPPMLTREATRQDMVLLGLRNFSDHLMSLGTPLPPRSSGRERQREGQPRRGQQCLQRGPGLCRVRTLHRGRGVLLSYLLLE